MNKVDQHIKRMMLQYPSLFPNRIKCLRQLFLVNGNGYDWDENGCLTDSCGSYDNRPEDKMRYDDLDTRNDDLAKILGEDDKVDTLSDIRKFQKLRDVKERLDREFCEQHIDLMCQFHDTWDNFSYADLQHFDVRWSAFHDAPYGNIDAVWLSAMEETVNKLKYAFNLIWFLHFDNPLRGEKQPEPSMFSRMPEKFQKMYTEIQEIEDKLEAQSGSKARAKEFWDSIKDDILK